MNTGKRIAQINNNLDRIESGRFAELSLSRCADFIAWMKQYHKAPDSTLDPIIDRITALYEGGFSNDYDF